MKCFHGLPMTPSIDMLRSMAGKHAMVSYEDHRQIEDAAEICASVVLDNGAFSAWRAGRAHDFDGYRQWAQKWIKHPCVEWCVIPDVIDGSEEDNDKLLADWDMRDAVSVPVYHMHESLERLERLIDRYPRIALGSCGVYAEPGASIWWERMASMMEVICDHEGMPRCKLHGLHMLDPVIFSHLPLSSADSCNVARNIGIDAKWNGPYSPKSRHSRAIIMMDRIEAHASAHRWCRISSGVQQNMELIG